MAHKPSSLVILAASVLSLAGGCAAPSRRPAVPAHEIDAAEVPGMPFVRTWSDQLSPEFQAEIERSVDREKQHLAAQGHTGPLPPAHFLAISGGGANGAYGAGLLAGWTAAGTRPTFKLVTGISTGALTAPFAFLGPAYDQQLKEVYTTVRSHQIFEERFILNGLFGDAFSDTAPLTRLLKKYVNAEMMAAVAAAYAEGRILLVGTSNLDAGRGVIWNMGAIASSGAPGALELFQSILIASSAIPAAFPPKMIAVEANGRRFEEMHVDGGAVAQVFVYPPSFEIGDTVSRERKLFVIRNSRLDPQWTEVQRSSLSIAARAIDTLIQTQGVGDLYRIYLTSQRDQVDFSVAYIPETFHGKPREAFDPVYMSRLFDVGYADGLQGAWQKHPPGFTPGTTTRP